MSERAFYLVAGLIFLIIAVMHVLRLALKWEVVPNGLSLPMWVSSVAALIAGYLAYEGLALARRL